MLITLPIPPGTRPRIRMARRCGWWTWECVSETREGYGRSPAEAYLHWSMGT